MGIAGRDANYVPTLIGVSNADGTTPITVYVDPTTHRLLVTGSNRADAEVPSGAINGSNVTFTLANAPSPAASLQLFQNGTLRQAGAGNDYTLSSATITMATAPLTGDVLVAYYVY